MKSLEYYTQHIKHCPLCGHPYDGFNIIIGYVNDDPTSVVTYYRIRCIPCNLSISQDREDKAIGMWNNRSNEPKDPATINVL